MKLFVLLLWSAPFVLLATEDLFVPLKRSSVLPLPAGSTLHLSDSSHLRLRDYKGQLLATGLKEGSTLLRHHKKSYQVFVLEESKIQNYHKLLSKIKNYMGLKLDICHTQVCLKGELLTFADYKDLTRWALRENVQWILKTQIRPAIQESLKNYISQIFLDRKLPELTFQLEPSAEIRVSKANSHLKPQLQEVFAPLGFSIVDDNSSLGLHPLVDLRVEIVEIKKSSFSKIGVDLPTQFKASIVPQGSSTLTPFDIALNALEQKGDARVMASPRLSCRSGEQAHFLAGGEFPIKIMNYRTNDIQWKKYGILLNFKPLADLSGHIRLNLTAEVSLLDMAQTVDGIPGLLVNRVESAVDMKSGETLSLSGLVKKIEGLSKQGISILSQIPILGFLFSSQDYRNDQSDLVIFITPRLL